MEFLWNMLTVLINRRLTSAIGFHDTLHGSRLVRGKVTASLKSNLLQHIISMREAILYKIFLDIQKVYNTLDRDRCLNILSGYGVVP